MIDATSFPFVISGSPSSHVLTLSEGMDPGWPTPPKEDQCVNSTSTCDRNQDSRSSVSSLLWLGEATISRWVAGARIQQRALDRFLRVCLASPAAVELLLGEKLIFEDEKAQKKSELLFL